MTRGGVPPCARWRHKWASVAILCLSLASTGALTGCASQTVSVRMENAALSVGPPNDASYTQRLQFSVQPQEPLYTPCPGDDECFSTSRLARFAERINFLREKYADDDSNVARADFVFGQEFYTPDDVSIPSVQQDDRPYAGWLYGGVRVHNFRQPSIIAGAQAGERCVGWKADRVRTVGLDIGVVGPWSMSGPTQKWWHTDIRGATYPHGWHNQLANEPGVILFAREQCRVGSTAVGRHLTADLIGSGQLAAGNIKTYAQAGVTARIGYNLPRGFTPDTMNGVGRGQLFDATRGGSRGSASRVYAFVSLTARAVLHDIFLDGSLFRDSRHTVDKEPLIGTASLGAGFEKGRWSIIASFMHQTRQFEVQMQAADRRGVRICG